MQHTEKPIGDFTEEHIEVQQPRADKEGVGKLV